MTRIHGSANSGDVVKMGGTNRYVKIAFIWSARAFGSLIVDLLWFSVWMCRQQSFTTEMDLNKYLFGDLNNYGLV